MNIVYIVKDMQPVTPLTMTSINNPSWQKAACFGTMFDIVSSLVDAHSITEVISMVSSELPLDTNANFQEA